MLRLGTGCFGVLILRVEGVYWVRCGDLESPCTVSD